MKVTVMVLLVLLFSTMCIGPGLFFAPIALIFGWVPAAGRLFKGWHFSAGMIPWLLMVLLLIGGTQAFLRWVYYRMHGDSPEATRPPWPWRWTLCAYAMLCCVLLAISSMILTTHQIYWICKSSDPLFSSPYRERAAIFSVASTLQSEAETNQWDASAVRAAFWQGNATRHGWAAGDELQPVWIEQEDRSLRAIILVPRRPLYRKKATLVVLQPGQRWQTHALTELPQLLLSFAGSNAVEAAKSSSVPP